MTHTTSHVPPVAVIGCGDWGKNLVRVFHRRRALRWICDSAPERLEQIGREYPGVRASRSVDDVLADGEVRALVIATPAATHFAIAKLGLAAGKDLFVEKPLALSFDDGKWLVEHAAAQRRILMVGHVLQYHPAVARLKQIVDAGDLGDLYYLYSNRLNLGRARREENILWSFAPHDISVMLLLAGRLPASITARGGNYLQREVADVTLCTYTFDTPLLGHIFVSWLHPFKEQRLVVVGSRKMAVFDDVAVDDKLCIYDKGITLDHGRLVTRQEAETRIPLPADEPLDAECAHFLECVDQRTTPRTDGEEGLRVLRVLEASQRSLLERRTVTLTTSTVAGYA
jgi:UDP-2-acetamido-3-amino-2,3-dideoxy-glucuronate N-acetyltransferase